MVVVRLVVLVPIVSVRTALIITWLTEECVAGTEE
eukprot:COSAG02_NODE_34061_length_490_cov_0.800512_2_plen_34_part_01